MELIIIRGPSGSGKSTLAKQIIEDYKTQCAMLRIVPSYEWHETDNYFVDDTGGYIFKPDLINRAHEWCKSNIEKAFISGIRTIIISNTFTRLWEFKHYIALAKLHNYDVSIYKTDQPWDPETLFNRNVHSVPLETIRKQIERYVTIPEEKQYMRKV